MDLVRIGKISTIDYQRGAASVVYTDRNNEPSPSFPFFSFAYDMPKVDDTVVVLLLPNSTTKGFILGVPWSGGRIPPESGPGVYYKEFPDGAYVKYDVGLKQMEVGAANILLKDVYAESIEVSGQLKAKSVNAENVSADSLTVKEMASFHNLEVSGKASFHDLEINGTVTGDFR